MIKLSREIIKKQQYITRSILFLFMLAMSITAEEVCKFEYLGLPELLDGDTITVPVKTVAMSEYVRIGDPGDLIIVGNACSIMFLVDVSGSNSSTDPDAERYEVMSAVIDTIYKKNPKVHVGLAYFGTTLWFNPSHDPVFIDTPGEKHGVIPLLQLDKMYDGHYVRLKFLSNAVAEQYDYTKAGIDVLKLYFKTQYINPWGIYPAYWGDASQNGLTGINEGFTGTKHAMATTSPHTKDKQFIIFFSDGGATTGTQYTQAENTPTTFTIFYNPSSGAWNELQQFNTNVQTNGFSTSNPMSNAWNMEMDKETLIKLIVDDILSQIITSMTTFISNDSVYINGLTGIKITPEGFYFEDLFPLKSKYTDFHYEIDYHITKDSIASNGDTVTIAEYDSTIYVDYTVCVDDGDSLSDSIRLAWWDRDLAFYYNGDEIEEDEFITEQMDEVELRFSYKEVDTLYEYGDVMDTLQFELRSKIVGDVEEYDLTDQGNYWSCNFPRELGSASSGDGTLQHKDGDSIIAIFRNGKLPLDTLRIGRLYDGVVSYALNKAIYFDNSGDGKVDSVYLGISGTDIDDYADEIMDNIILPAHRNFALGTYAVVSGGIGVPVTENATATLTYCTSLDFIEITDSVALDTDVFLLPGKVNIIDSIAPVIMSATLIDSVKVGARDELTVVFSETIESITEGEPFNFYKTSQGILYEATLSVLNQSNATCLFEVVSVTGTSEIVHGDSIRIDWALTGKIGDGLGNVQDNPANIRREINVIPVEEGLKLTKGIYFDNNADGKVDSIFIGVYGEIEDYIDELMDAIVLPAYRQFTVITPQYTTGGIGIDVTEGNTAILTFVNDEDVIEIKEEVLLPDSMVILKAKVDVIDSIAPVIMSASYITTITFEQQGSTITLVNSGSDTLDVVLSETVETITRDKPFKFYCTSQSTSYDAELAVASQNSNLGRFTVTSLNGVSAITAGDSIRINWIYTDNVYDAIGNNQDNPKNIRRLIDVRVEKDTIYIPLDFTLIPKATILNLSSKKGINLDGIKHIPEISDALQFIDEGSNGYTGLMIITLEPDPMENVSNQDSYSGTLHIFDAVGNEIARNIPMGYDENTKQLIGLWNGRNTLDRVVGPGGYAAIMPVDMYFKGEKSRRVTFQKTIGVQE